MIRNTTVVWLAAGLLLLGAVAEYGESKGGISGSGSTRGALQRFASIVVNDTELDTSQALVFVNGAPASLQALRVGQQVEAESLALESGQADTITYFSSARGPIESIDTAAGTLRVLGQDVITSAATNFDRTALLDLAVGLWVDVSGIRTGASTLEATYLRRVTADTPVRLTGTLQRISSTGTLRVAGVPVASTEAQRAGLTVGDTVSVNGALNASGAAIRAQRIWRIDPVDAETLNVSLEGAVRRVGANRLDIGRDAFALTAATEFVNTTPGRLLADDRVHVEAVRTDAGLLATAVVYRPTRDVRVEGIIDSIESLTSDSARVVVSGLPMLVNQGTDFGRSSNPIKNVAKLADLRIGDYLKVRAYVDGREAAVHRLDRVPYEDRARINALVSAKTDAGFEVLGSTVALGPDTAYEVAGQSVPLAQFLATLEVGDFVDIDYDGDWTPGMTPDKVSIDDSD